MGLFAFWAILLVFNTLTWLWVSGRLGGESEKTSPALTGRVVRFSLGNKKFAIRLGKEFWIRVAFIVLGPVAILSLSAAYANLIPLRLTFSLIVLPAYMMMLSIGIAFRPWGKRALLGFSAGVVATLVYDVVRLGIAFALGLADPIPHIGTLLIGADLDGSFWWVGYLWRLFGNGAGMAIVYSMLPRWFHNVRGGLVFGSMVSFGMLGVLLLFPAAQAQLFVLNKLTVINSFIGHWTYGGILGLIFGRTKAREELPSPEVKDRPVTWDKNQV